MRSIPILSPLVLACIFVGCTSLSDKREAKLPSETIHLIKRSTENDHFVTDIEGLVDGSKTLFLLDTGAATSSLAEDEHTKAYPSLGKEDAKGAAGKATPCDIVQPRQISIGNLAFHHPRIKRCRTNILGLDLLGPSGFEVDLAGLKLLIGKSTDRKLQFPLRRLSRGHITIPLKIQDQVVDALFDTGADTTVIDSQFVQRNPQLFEPIRSEEGTDALGNKIASQIYRCRSIQAGKLRLENVEMAAFDFGDFLRSRMEGSPLILGNNIISHAKWSFDLKNGLWGNEAKIR
jgi:predicted aspartyl protease